MTATLNLTAKLDQVNDYRFIEAKDVKDWKDWREVERNKIRKTRVYIHIKGENVIQNLMERHNRPYKLWQPLVEKVLSDAGFCYDSIKWSQKAGCGCGCSPAFVLTGSFGRDVWVEIS